MSKPKDIVRIDLTNSKQVVKETGEADASS
jgi:hypothetical protein